VLADRKRADIAKNPRAAQRRRQSKTPPFLWSWRVQAPRWGADGPRIQAVAWISVPTSWVGQKATFLYAMRFKLGLPRAFARRQSGC